MALTHRRSALAAAVITAAAATALAGIAVDAETGLFAHAAQGVQAAAPIPEVAGEPDAAEAAAEAEAEAGRLGSAFEVAATVGGVTATLDNTTVSVVADAGDTTVVNLNRDQTYVFSGGKRWFVGADRPVAVFSGRDRRVQPIR